MQRRTYNCIGRAMVLALLCLAFFFTSGCNASENASMVNDIYCLNDVYSPYIELVSQILPDYSVGRTERVYAFLQKKETIAVEAFDAQALPAIAHGVADYWYPQFIATVIIALDRDRTDADIRGWSDLMVANEDVGINGVSISQMIFSAIAYGLEGDDYTFTSAANLLVKLRKDGFLYKSSFEPAILICYDFQAAAMIKEGRNLEIVVPREGTFSYVRGLLSNKELSFGGDIDLSLISAGLRLLDGRCDDNLYPDAVEYEAAVNVTDYDRFNTICLNGERIFRRTVLNTRLYSSVDNREHQLFPLLFIIILIVWAASVFRRAMQNNVRKSALVTVIILLGWMFVRLFKYQILDESTLGLYLWYSYYPFQLALPLVALFLAYTIDRQGESRPPKWLYVLAAIDVIFIILIFTSHIHGFVFQIDFTKLKWANDYGYGLGYTIMQFSTYALMGLAVVMMIIKCGRSSHKKSLVFPVVFLAALFTYAYGYSAKIPIARDSDMTMVISLFVLMFFESALRTGLIPVNTNYTTLFENTPLKIQILDNNGHVTLSSATATGYSPDIIDKALFAHPLPLHADENTLLFVNKIVGGNVLWQEDISGLNRLHAEVDESVNKLISTNDMLAEEGKIKRILAEEKDKDQLMSQLEAEIASYTEKLSFMAQQLENADDKQRKVAEIAILLCYVKRRCNLFFREQETHTMVAFELVGYLEELAGIAAYSGKKITISSDVNENLSIRRATLFYDFFYSVIDWAAQQSCPHVMVHLMIKNKTINMSLLPYSNPKDFNPDSRLLEAIALANGKIAKEDLDDAAAISLSFPQGGGNSD